MALLALDQGTKTLAGQYLRTNGPLVIWPGVFELRYLENTGAAFGMLKNHQWMFILFAAVIAAGAGYFYLELSVRRLKGAQKRWPLQLVCVLLLSGALGNMIDRIVHRYVIDFFYFSLIDFPIFNVADIYVCTGTGLLLVLLLFYYKDVSFERQS